MLDIGWPEFTLILIIGLLVIGPKDLPKALHTVGKWVRKARAVTGEFQRHVDDMVKDSDLSELKELRKLNKASIAKELRNTIDPTGEVEKTLKTRVTGKPGDTDKADGEADDDVDAIRQQKLDAVRAAAKNPPPLEGAADDETSSVAGAPSDTKSAAPVPVRPSKKYADMNAEERAAWRENYRKQAAAMAGNAASVPRTVPQAAKPAQAAPPATVDTAANDATTAEPAEPTTSASGG